jgi:hypothetical protein
MSMRTPLIVAALATLAAVTAGASLDVRAQAEVKSVPLPPPVTQTAQILPSAEALAWSQKALAGWPDATRRLAAQLVTKYGQPVESTPRQVTWINSGQWVRTTLYKEGNQHNFASPHRNILEQAVLYKVPPEKLAALAAFNRSVVANLARGELISSSDSEELNFLAINVADDIVKGERTPEEGRIYFAQIVRAKMIKEPERDLQQLNFTVAKSPKDTADADEVAPLIKHMSGADAPPPAGQ